LQNTLSPIKENKNTMKNLKSINEFCTNESLNEGKKAKAKKPNDVITVDVDLSGDDSDIMDAIKSFNLTAKPNGANNGTGYDLTGKKKDLLGYLQSDYYALEASDIEDMFPELLESSVNENDANVIVKAFMKTYNKRDEVTAEDWEQFIYDWTVVGDGSNELDSEIGYDTMDDVLTMLDKKGYKKLDDEGIIGLYESSVNEEYVESMDSIEIGNALGKIEELWKDWRKGPMTEPSDIKPAQKELKGWIDRWFKQTIK
jgi:hypothetical protein